MAGDEFIREVDEEYRRDRIARVWARYSGVIVGLAILLVAAVGGWRYWQHEQAWRAEVAAERFDDAVRLARDGKGEEAERALGALAGDAPAGYRVLARMRAAAEAGSRDAEAGAKAFDAIGEDTAFDATFRDLAKLRAAMLRLDGPGAEAGLTVLQGFAAPTNPWRHTARELLGVTALKRGDYEGAGRWFDAIAADRETPAGLRQRLAIYAALVAGGPATATQ